MTIRPATSADREALLAIWLASVRATHRFLSEDAIQALVPDVKIYLASADAALWVLCDRGADASTLPIGFMGLSGSSVDALFISPRRTRRGGGRALLAHARFLAGRPLTVDVNEQNPEALAFYRASGFSFVGRSPTDDAGRPYPIVHLRESEDATLRR